MKARLWLPFALGLSLFTVSVASAAVSEHVSQILITQGIRYQADDAAGPWHVFTLEVDTDASVIEIRFDTPAGHSFTIPVMPDQYDPVTGIRTDREYFEQEDVWEWEFELTSEDPEALNVFGDGEYVIAVVYGGGSDQLVVSYLMPGSGLPLPQPTQVPIPSQPMPGAAVDSPVTFAWEACTDSAVTGIWVGAEQTNQTDEVGVEWLIGADQTQWGPVACTDGRWRGRLEFYHAEGPIDVQGVECWTGKYVQSEWVFGVGGAFPIYDVWAGTTDYLQEPDGWNMYWNIDLSDYVRLGGSDGYTATFKGDYPYYVLVTREPLLVDCIKGSDGNCYMGAWVTANVEEGWYMSAHDGWYGTVGSPSGQRFMGFVRVENPGHWDAITIVTDKTVDCPDGDITGDCFVDLQDLAILAADWLGGTRIVY